MTRRILLAVLLALPAAAQSTDTYQVVFLRPAPDRKVLPKDEGDRLMAAHMANIHAMAARGVLVSAGPFGDNPPTLSGVFLFKLPALAEAIRIAAEDPTVTAHRNTVEGFTWTGPKGVGEEYKRLHAADPNTPEDMGVHPFVLLREAPASGTLTDRRILAAGPITGSPEFKYLLILTRIPDDEARRLIDPAWKPEVHRWWSAAHVFPK